MIDDLYLSTNQLTQKVYVVIEETFVPYESTSRRIHSVFNSFEKANAYCKSNPLSSSSSSVRRSYDIEVHEVE